MTLPASLTIGGLTFSPPILLAPMAGYSDYAFRSGLRAVGGVGLAYTEMLSPASLLQGKGQKRKTQLATDDADQPLGYQIYGTRAPDLCRAAQWLEAHGAPLVDINMGCPQRKISNHGAGAGLLRDPIEAIRIAGEVVRSVRIPVTVKLRLGWDAGSLVAPDMVPGLEAVGVAAITIHGRTRGQGYTGEADRSAMRRVVQAARHVPVIANGDVTSPAAARRLFDETGCAGIMIGRGALANPWLIRDIARDLQGLPPAPAPTWDERMAYMQTHFERVVALYGPVGGTLLYRKWIPQYVRKCLRDRPRMVSWLQVTDPDEIRRLMAELAAEKGGD